MRQQGDSANFIKVNGVAQYMYDNYIISSHTIFIYIIKPSSLSFYTRSRHCLEAIAWLVHLR